MQHRDEIIALADYLDHYQERKPANQFFCLSYFQIATQHMLPIHRNSLLDFDPNLHLQDGIAVCAIGAGIHARILTGLHLEPVLGNGPISVFYQPPGHEMLHDADAIAYYFAISKSTVYYLFYPQQYPITDYVYPAAVAQRLHAWLDANQELKLPD